MFINWHKFGSMTRLLRRAFHNYGKIFAIVLVLGFIGGLCEGVGIATVIPLFYLMTGQSLDSAGPISHLMRILFQIVHVNLTPPALLGAMVFLFILKAVVQFGVRYANARVVNRFEQTLRYTLMRRTLQADWPYLLRQKSGHLESILLYDVDRSSNVMSMIAQTIIFCTTFAAYIAVALTISWRITALTLAIGAVIFYLLKPIFYRIRKLQGEAAQFQKDMNHQVAQNMMSVKSIKAMALEKPAALKSYGLFERIRRAKIATAFYRQGSLALIEPLGFLVIAALFLANWHHPGFSIISFAVVMYLVQRMFGYVSSITGQVQAINEGFPYLKAAMDWRRNAGRNAERDAGTRDFIFARELTFENVSFVYRSEHPVLTDFTLTIPKGQLIGLVGPSGVGKTTVVDLVMRLLEPQQGRILADGMDIRDIHLADWRAHIAYAPQEVTLINDTIRENIRFYTKASDHDIVEAAQAANIHDTIASLPQGYDTPVGERGVNLSGGQRQRIALARALARKPIVLILDEATSAIDAESEQLIHQAIAGLRGKTTVIVITHRLSTVQHLDRIVVLEHGAISEDGTPEHLMHQSESYVTRLLALK